MRRTILPDRIGWSMSQNIGDYMLKYLAAVAGAAVLATPTLAGIEAFPGNFHTQMIQINGTSLYVRAGGHLAARLWRYRGYVGAACSCIGQGSHRHRA